MARIAAAKPYAPAQFSGARPPLIIEEAAADIHY
jgi:hypothetical protein